MNPTPRTIVAGDHAAGEREPPRSYRASAFGIGWDADLPLSEFREAGDRALGAPLGEVRVRRASSLRPRVPLCRVNRGTVFADGIRLHWGDEVVFDMVAGERVDYMPQRCWRGALPAAFYSTVAALTAAWLGAVPLHACAVEIDGCAFLIAGASGAGKSSLAAGLLEFGARLVSDDLTVVRVGEAGGRIEVFQGRPAMRQHVATAAFISAQERAPVAGDSREKWLVRPVSLSSAPSLPLAGILLLDRLGRSMDASQRVAFLGLHLFRPRWMAALPNRASHRRDLIAIASAVPMQTFAAVAQFDPLTHARRAELALRAFEAMRRP